MSFTLRNKNVQKEYLYNVMAVMRNPKASNETKLGYYRAAVNRVLGRAGVPAVKIILKVMGSGATANALDWQIELNSKVFSEKCWNFPYVAS